MTPEGRRAAGFCSDLLDVVEASDLLDVVEAFSSSFVTQGRTAAKVMVSCEVTRFFGDGPSGVAGE